MLNNFDKIFERHVIMEKITSECGCVGYYRLANPSDSNCSFSVTYSPNTICFSGDAGNLVFENKPIAWLKNASSSVGYLLEKVACPERDHLRQFSLSTAEEWLAEIEEDLRHDMKQIEEREEETEEDIQEMQTLEAKLLIVEEVNEWLEHDVHELNLTEAHVDFLNKTNTLYDETPHLEEMTVETKRMVAAVHCFVRLVLT